MRAKHRSVVPDATARAGVVLRVAFLGAGRVWGEDFLLAPDMEMIDHAQAVALPGGWSQQLFPTCRWLPLTVPLS